MLVPNLRLGTRSLKLLLREAGGIGFLKALFLREVT